MTDKQEFGNAGDPSDNKQNFSQENDQTEDQNDGGSNLTPEKIAEILKRDENAQQHIPRIEAENEELRQQLAELEAKVEAGATLDEVLNRLDNKSGNTGSTVDPDELTKQVEERLQNKAKEATREQNWTKVLSDLQEQHGSLNEVDIYVSERSAELGMSLQEATNLAKNSPAAFMKLYAKEGARAPQQGTASAAHSQTSNEQTKVPSGRDREYYRKLMRENPRKYWKEETQRQYRIDRQYWKN